MKRWFSDKSYYLLILIFVVATALIFFLMGLTYKHLNKLSDNTASVTHSYDVTLLLQKLYSTLKDAETTKRNYIVTSEPQLKQDLLEKKTIIQKELRNLRNEVKDNALQTRNVDTLKQMIEDNNKIIDIALSGNISLDDEIHFRKYHLAGRAIIAAISKKIDEMEEVENTLMKRRKSEFIYTQKHTPLFIYLISIFALGLLSFTFYRIFTDVKEQKNINSRLQLALDTSHLAEIIGGFGVWIMDLDTQSFIFSDNEYRLLGYSPQQFSPSYNAFVKHVHPDDLDKVNQKFGQLFRQESTKPFSFRVYRKDGALRYFEINARAINSKNGEKVMLGITSDITVQVLAKKQMAEQNRILEANNQELMAFNYVASHDLQEPLRKIETFISRLNDKDRANLTESGKSYIDKMQRSAGRMRTLIEDLLQFSRTTRAEKIYVKTDLNEVMAIVLEDMNSMVEEKSAKIIVSPLPTIEGIPFQLQQLFTNLINNALKYSKEGISPIIKIEQEMVLAENDPHLSAFATGEFTKIKFIDNGIGFEQQYAKKIFEVFNRLHNKYEYAGTGIGLAVCKKIVENHRGCIFAEGVPEVGAVFTVYLPTDFHKNTYFSA